MKKTIYIIDAHAYIHRAYHALPVLTTTKGVMVNAVYGFLKLLLKILRDKKPDFFAVCFDYPAPTFRHGLYPDYKANRKEIEPSLKEQIPLARKITEEMGFPVYEKRGFEADDVIGTISVQAKKMGLKSVIVTGDKDSLQLINEDVMVYNEHKDILWDEQRVSDEFGLKPGQFIDLLALSGDSSDNIPGVSGVGEKTALKLIQEYHSLDNLMNNTEKIQGKLKEKIIKDKEKAFLSYRLAKINTEVPVVFDLKYSSAEMPKADGRVLEILKEYEFMSFMKDLAADMPCKTADSRGVCYEILDEHNKALELIKKLREEEMFAFDVETDSLDVFKAKISGISFSFAGYRAYYLPFRGKGKTLDLTILFEPLKGLLGDLDVKKIGHNLKYDYQVLKNNGIEACGIYFDTMIASYLLNPARRNSGLKDLSREIFGAEMKRYENIEDKEDIAEMGLYACADADFTWRLYEYFKPKLSELELNTLADDIEMPLVKILADMELAGIRVDTAYLQSLANELQKNIDRLVMEIYSIAGGEFNTNSPKQLAFILFEKLKLPFIRKTKTGYSTDEDTLYELSKVHMLPKLIIEYREYQKIKSTYADSILEKTDKNLSRIHASFNQAVTATGRLSSSDPNLQNIPIRKEIGRKIRKAFVADEDYIFLSADYSQIDLRMLAHISEDPVLLEAFNKGEDIHRLTASEIFGINPQDVSTEQRDAAKTINFGIIYGQQAFGLSQSLGIGIKEADDYINGYFRKYAGVKRWIETNIEKARSTGMVRTLFNRVRFVPDINSKNGQLRSAAERLATNTPIQGSSADVIKAAMVKIYSELRQKQFKSKILLQVHDDLLIETAQNEMDEIKKILVNNMENACKLKVPLKVSLKMGYNWEEMKHHSPAV